MDRSKMTEHIQVNLPLTQQEYESGNGEGVWVLVDADTKHAYDLDAVGTGYSGILDNDSIYYPDLSHGTLIPFEMRGAFRPVVDFPEFLSKRSRLTPEGKALVIGKLAEQQKPQSFE